MYASSTARNAVKPLPLRGECHVRCPPPYGDYSYHGLERSLKEVTEATELKQATLGPCLQDSSQEDQTCAVTEEGSADPDQDRRVGGNRRQLT